MVIPTFKFSDFNSQENFMALKKHFLTQDYKHEYSRKILDWVNNKEIEKIEDNPKIIINIKDYSTDSDVSIKKEFIGDFLKPNIKQIANRAYLEFKSELVNKGIYDPKSVDGLASHLLNKLNIDIELIKRAEFLDEKIKHSLLEEAEKFNLLIENHLEYPYPELKEILQFKWKRTDVVYFFHLLRKSKVISQISDADLGRIIDNTCEYWGGKEEGFLQIKNSRKHLSDYNSGDKRPETPAIERIKEIFSEENLYD